MKIHIAKHYWKNGVHATWEYHPKLDQEIFAYLKEHYHHFVKERKPFIQKDGYFIYLCYEDAKDEHQRDITNITFFVAPAKPKKELNLCDKVYTNLELTLRSKKDDQKLIIVAFGSIIMLLVFGYFFIKNISHTPKPITPIVQNYNRFIDTWNQQVQQLTDKKTYLLSRESNAVLISQLNDLQKAFYQGLNLSLYDEYKQGSIKKYQQYREKHHLNKEAKIVFTNSMSSDEIKESLRKITKERAISEMVKKVLMMNDIDIFLQESKE